MANPAAFADGSQTCVIGTEHFLSSPNAVGTYIMTLDMNAAAAGDFFIIRAYKMARTGGTQRPLYVDTIQGAQPADEKMWDSLPIANVLTDTNSLRFSIQQILGTGRAIPWSVQQYT